MFTERGSCVITGRSDATLNRGGVRLGTGEFYPVVEALDEIVDSLVVHLEDRDGGPGELILFVVRGRRRRRRRCACARGSRRRCAGRCRPATSRHARGGAGDPAHADREEARAAGQADPARRSGRRGRQPRRARGPAGARRLRRLRRAARGGQPVVVSAAGRAHAHRCRAAGFALAWRRTRERPRGDEGRGDRRAGSECPGGRAWRPRALAFAHRAQCPGARGVDRHPRRDPPAVRRALDPADADAPSTVRSRGGASATWRSWTARPRRSWPAAGAPPPGSATQRSSVCSSSARASSRCASARAS